MTIAYLLWQLVCKMPDFDPTWNEIMVNNYIQHMQWIMDLHTKYMIDKKCETLPATGETPTEQVETHSP